MTASRLGRALDRPPADWAVAARAWVLLPLISLALRVLPLHRLEELVAAGREPAAAAAAPAERAAEVRRLRRLVAAAAHRLPFTPQCLPRSLCLLHLLSRRGIDAELRIGVRRQAERLTAHAWLEVDGSAVGEPEDVALRFVPLERAGQTRDGVERESG